MKLYLAVDVTIEGPRTTFEELADAVEIELEAMSVELGDTTGEISVTGIGHTIAEMQESQRRRIRR